MFLSPLRRSLRGSAGYTLTEVLVALAIVGFLFIAMMLSLRTQRSRAADAERKTDLERIRVAFEDYYNDNACYPAEGVLDDCEGTSFRPYLSKISCDPTTQEPYLYVPAANPCDGYRVYAVLQTTTDPIIEALGCDTPTNCGVGGGYNYGISAGLPVYSDDPLPTPNPNATPSPGATPAPSPSPGATEPPLFEYACDNGGTCNEFAVGSPLLDNCPITFEDRFCENRCGDPTTHCQ